MGPVITQAGWLGAHQYDALSAVKKPGKLCAELPRRECRISVWVNR